MTTTLVLIRHGQTDWNVAGRWQGEADIPLNENGRLQAQKVAQRLKNWSLQALISSDLQRAAATAQAIGEVCGLTPIYSAAWQERAVGDFSGMTGAQAREKYPDVFSATKSIGGVLNPPNGEQFTDFHRRAITAYETAVSEYDGQTIAIVSHGATLAIILSQVIGVPEGQFGRFRLNGNTGISVVQVDDGSAHVVRLNDTAHLE